MRRRIDPSVSRRWAACRAPLIVLGMTLALVLPAEDARAQTSALVEFELEDQHQQVHRHSDFEGRVVVLVGGDRDGRQFGAGWERAILDAAADALRRDRLALVSLADVPGVPVFVRKYVRSKFPTARDDWVLLDWSGQFAQAYDFVPGAINVLVFAADGSLRMRTSARAVSDEQLQPIVEVLLAELATPP
jgi:hypothetical protein